MEKTNRELAIDWWNMQNKSKQNDLIMIHLFATNYKPTSREIELIWKKENPIEALPDELINIDFDGIEEEHTSEKICRVCGGIGQESTGLINVHNIHKSYLRGEVEFETKQIECLKCNDCGHSWT